jgi:hypothetical protein
MSSIKWTIARAVLAFALGWLGVMLTSCVPEGNPDRSTVLMGIGHWNAGKSTLHDHHCTAVKIGERVFLTAAHCTEGKDAAELQIGGDWVPARPVFQGNLKAGQDFSILVVDVLTPAIPAAQIRTTPLKVGEVVTAIGWPTPTNVKTTTWGRVSANPVMVHVAPDDDEQGRWHLHPEAEPVPDAGPFIMADLSLARGNSGGPLFDEDGYLVGINVSLTLDKIAGGMGFIVIPTHEALIVPMTEVCKVVGWCPR